MTRCNVAIVGGGAAGFFCALQVAQARPQAKIIILEKTNQLLSKVRISGGGRCNVTHKCFEAAPLAQHYPRGRALLKKQFRLFQPADMVAWLAERGVATKAEEDGRIFPVTDQSETIVNCFLREAQKANVEIQLQREATGLTRQDSEWVLHTLRGEEVRAKKIVLAMGGHAKPQAYQWLGEAGVDVTPTIPSLFTFNHRDKTFADLMGISVADAEVRLAGTKFLQRGAVLITHWGLSGPAVIKLSAWAAPFLHQNAYRFTALVNWLGGIKEDELRNIWLALRTATRSPKVANYASAIPARLWQRLCQLAKIGSDKTWKELPLNDLNRLIEFTIRCPFVIQGKTTFKEEFVTCGGIALHQLHPDTMEIKAMPGVYAAGEVVDIDGETGGFNFQAAWTTAYLAARHISYTL